MVISQKYAAIAVDYTNENRKKKGVILDENYLEVYKKKLRKYAEDRNIMENADLDFDVNNIIAQDSIISQADSNEFELVIEENNDSIVNDEDIRGILDKAREELGVDLLEILFCLRVMADMEL